MSFRLEEKSGTITFKRQTPRRHSISEGTEIKSISKQLFNKTIAKVFPSQRKKWSYAHKKHLESQIDRTREDLQTYPSQNVTNADKGTVESCKVGERRWPGVMMLAAQDGYLSSTPKNPDGGRELPFTSCSLLSTHEVACSQHKQPISKVTS